jgi:hypothetical protein
MDEDHQEAGQARACIIVPSLGRQTQVKHGVSGYRIGIWCRPTPLDYYFFYI